ncbi:uncharacterized protein AB9W97_007393 isoform 2-T2 [Spinachia spinachia]
MSPAETCTTAAALLGVLLAAVSAGPETPVYGKLGGEVVLKPSDPPVPSSIEWKQGDDLVVQWDGAVIDLYRQFRARGSLNLSNGELTITGLTPNESGYYTPEINKILGPKMQLIVIPPVPKPTVSKRCDNEKAVCVLSCDGDVADAAPVAYGWGAGHPAASKELRLTKEGSSGVREFRCELRNPVSAETSGPAPNPFSTGPNFSTGGVVFGALLVAVLLLVAAHRCVAGESGFFSWPLLSVCVVSRSTARALIVPFLFPLGMWFFQKNSMPWEPNFWREHEKQPPNGSVPNGPGVEERGQSDEETPLS